jgi:5-methyltetrahydropteroyltriglutamate--homocysteine methyltransferase
MTKAYPFFRADHVGSLLRTPELMETRQKWKAGELPADTLRAVEDEAIAGVAKLQENLGLKVITDGEYRRENWWIDFISQIPGVEIAGDDESAEFMIDGGKGSGYIPKVVRTVGKITHDKVLLGRDYEVLAKATSETPKITLPSPTRIHFHGGRAAINETHYPTMEEYWADVAKFYQDEIAALEDLGCRYIQIDDPVLTYFLDDRMNDNLRRIGENPDTLIHDYAKLLNACVKNRKPETHISMHLCRGNAASSWIVSGGYARLAQAIFPVVDVDTFFLEYDDDRSGDFEPLKHVAKDRNVVLGLVTSKFGDIESADSIKRRIDEAATIVPMDNLALSPQCGFASIDTGNLISVADQNAKLELVVKTAEEVWGSS